MAKKPLDIKLDFSKPILIETLKIGDNKCFTNDWEISHSSCLKCSLYDVCMVGFLSKGLDKKRQEIKSSTTHFLDELDWDKVPWNDIKEMVKESPGTLHLKDLRETIRELAKVVDNTTLYMKINNFLLDNNIQIKDGWLY